MTVTLIASDEAATEADDRSSVDRFRAQLNAVIRGKAEALDLVVVCLLARGHLLLEDRPGLGKTTLAKAIARGIGGEFARVQCTPDLLPSDITGFNVLNQKAMEFEFRPGPVFSDVLLADEINRATPRTQSALLEAMAERQVTVDAKRYPLPAEFFVIATQNPSDQHGTYPLPEAQLDRFAMKLQLGYPSEENELQVLQSDVGGSQIASENDAASHTLNRQSLRRLQERVARVMIAESLQRYLIAFAWETRRHPRISLGLSPRGLLVWQRTAQAQAFLSGRSYVVPDDLHRVAREVLLVRLAIDADQPDQVVEDLLTNVPLPESRPANWRAS